MISCFFIFILLLTFHPLGADLKYGNWAKKKKTKPQGQLVKKKKKRNFFLKTHS